MFTLRDQGKYFEVEMHDPSSANAFSLGAARELLSIVRTHRRERRPALFMSAHPRLFCSGGNLSEHRRLKSKREGLRQAREITRALDAFAAWPIRKLAVIEGDALGGGLEFLARFDERWATTSAAFGFWQARLGEAAALARLEDPRLLVSFEAERYGLVDRVLSADTIRTEARAWAEHYVAVPWSVRGEVALFKARWWGPAHRKALDLAPKRIPRT